MARPLRIEFPGAWYHAMNRVAGRAMAFKAAGNQRLFLALLPDLPERFGVEIHAYCLMGNHYHLLLQTSDANLGRALRHFNGVLTQRINRQQRRDGPLFRGRYKALLVDADHYLLALSRYIHRNPLAAGLVKRLDHYTLSSYPAYLGQAKQAWLHTERVLDHFGRGAIGKYRAYVEHAGPDELSDFYTQERPGSILGDNAFKARMLKGRRPHREQPQSRHTSSPVTLDEILKAVSHEFEVSDTVLRKTKRGRGMRNLPRAIAMYLDQTMGRRRLTQIAAAFNVSHYSTVSATIGRLRRELETDPKLAKQLAAIQARLR